jgi:hypothetical protein
VSFAEEEDICRYSEKINSRVNKGNWRDRLLSFPSYPQVSDKIRKIIKKWYMCVCVWLSGEEGYNIGK